MLLDIIKNKQIAIVGPSSSLIDKKMGKIIDNFDVVIRINRFCDRVLSIEDYGEKVDILFFNFIHIPNNRILKYNPKLIVSARPPRAERGSKRISNYKSNYKKSIELYKNIKHEEYPEKDIPSQLNQIIDNGKMKTSGFCVIFLLIHYIDLMESLTIFGIDFCFNKYNPKYNYWHFSGHSFDEELILFKKLITNLCEKKKQKIIIKDEQFLKYLSN